MGSRGPVRPTLLRALCACTLFACAILISFCASLDEKPKTTEEEIARESPRQPGYLALLQNGKRMTVRDGDRLLIERSAFAFIFPLPHYDGERSIFHSVQIAGSGNRAFLELPLGSRVDEIHNGLVLFAPGTGMASDETGRYPAFYLEENQAHHYIIFAPGDPEAQRAVPLRTLAADETEVRFDVLRFRFQEKLVEPRSLPLREIYFALLMDRNRNGIMEEGELFRFTLAFR